MLGDVAVQAAAAIVADDEEAVEHTEGDCRNGEEVHRRDSFSVASQKRKPALRRLKISWCSAHPARHGSLGYVESQHQKFSVDARCSPCGVLRNHSENEIANFLGDAFATDGLPRSRDRAPIQGEPGPGQRTTV